MHLQDTGITVAAHLEERRGVFHMLFSWKDPDGKRRRLSKTTGLPVENNCERAKAMLEAQRLTIESTLVEKCLSRPTISKAAPEDFGSSAPIAYDPNVTGHLELSKGMYRMRIRWINPDGTKGRKMISTGLSDKRGNRRRADGVLDDTCDEIKQELTALAIEHARKAEAEKENSSGNILFSDFLVQWLNYKADDQSNEKRISEVTWAGYQGVIQSVLAPHFENTGLRVADITAEIIEAFYSLRRETVKGTTILHDHAVITGALKHAGKLGIVEKYLYREIPRPKKEPYEASFLRESEVVDICKALDGHYLKLGFVLGAYYGLRRSEVVGLRWRSVDMEANTITIEHTVHNVLLNGKKTLLKKNTTKSKKSRRTLPLIPIFKEMLIKVQEEQRHYREICGNCYNNKDSEYIYTDPLGNLINPERLTREFPKFLAKHGFRRVRFHDLRHSCASLLLANGVSLKEVQEWLGHSDFSITANTYGHLDYESKVRIANSIGWMNRAEGRVDGQVKPNKKPTPALTLRGVRKKRPK